MSSPILMYFADTNAYAPSGCSTSIQSPEIRFSFTKSPLAKRPTMPNCSLPPARTLSLLAVILPSFTKAIYTQVCPPGGMAILSHSNGSPSLEGFTFTLAKTFTESPFLSWVTLSPIKLARALTFTRSADTVPAFAGLISLTIFFADISARGINDISAIKRKRLYKFIEAQV